MRSIPARREKELLAFSAWKRQQQPCPWVSHWIGKKVLYWEIVQLALSNKNLVRAGGQGFLLIGLYKSLEFQVPSVNSDNTFAHTDVFQSIEPDLYPLVLT